MERRLYISNWLSNASVAALIVGGFQAEMNLWLRLLALMAAVVACILGLVLAKEWKR